MGSEDTTRDSRSAKQVTRKAIPLEKAHIHDTAYTANADFLAPDIEPSDAPCLFRVLVCLDTAAVFKVVVDDGSTEVDMAMNGGAQLTAQAVYMFDVLVHADDTINFEADQSVQIEKFIVQEVLWAVQ